MIYTVDTNIIGFLQRSHPRRYFPTIWEWLEDELESGELCICPKVIEELVRTGGDQNTEMVRKFKDICPCSSASPALAEITSVREIGLRYPQWVRGTQNDADPWIIAHALAHQGGIMTKEGGSQGAPSNPKIPFVANEMYGVESLDFFGYAEKYDLTF